MVRISLVTLLLFFCLPNAQAQVGLVLPDNITPGPVWRVSMFKVKPGKMPEVMKEWAQNLRPINEELKKQGLIVDYRLYINSTAESPGDWNYAVAVAYRNWAALDDLGQKADAIALRHFGTREKRQEAIDRRNQIRELVSTRLMREVTLNPLP